MAETLFTDIINNLGKAKKEGKISGGYRYKDGKLNIGGGYYGDDSMFEIDVNKDGGNILFKKRFADGGSPMNDYKHYVLKSELSEKVKELMDDGYEFGEAVKEAMRQGYNKGGRINFDSGGSPLQQLRQSLVDDLMYKFPSMKEEDMQMIVKDINLDMSTEEAQASMSANFSKVFGKSGMFSTGGVATMLGE